MKFAFSALGSAGIRRPIVDVRFGGSTHRVACLVDSGAFGIRAGADVAAAVGIDVSLGSTGHVVIGGATRFGWTVPDVDLRVGRSRWRSPVTFIENFDYMPVLGIEGFFDHFDVTVAAQRGETRLNRP